MAKPKNLVLRETTEQYLQTISKNNPPAPSVIEEQLLTLIEQEYDAQHNAIAAKGRKWSVPETLPFSVIADIMLHLYDICRISCSGENADSDCDLLAIYQTEGDNKGTYATSEDTFRTVARQYNYNLSKHDFEELMIALHDKVPRKTRCIDRDIIAVNNGLFNYETKQLMPFDPDKVFLTKSHVDYNPNATNVTIHNDNDNTDWDIESWIDELNDDPEITQLIWEILGAIIRPHVRWNKSAWFYSESGNNGKGSLCELMRQLCGAGAYASISIEDFSKEFLLEPLMRATAVIVDENNVGSYVDKAANLKAVITNDVIQINRKFKTPVNYQFYGFMVQCLNEFPKIRDRSDSFYRRQLFVPFNKCFTGAERRYIKNDYLHRKEVLEYVLFKVLNTNYYHLSEPEACKEVLAEYKEFNDPIRQFWDEVKDQFKWDLLPFDFLFDLYKAWISRNIPHSQMLGRTKFVKELLGIIDPTTDLWYCEGPRKTIRVSHKMDKPEPLIARYDLSEWKNKAYTGNDITKICMATLNESGVYRGLKRVIVSASGEPVLDDESDDIENCE